MNMENLVESILSVARGMVKSGTDVRKVEDSLKRMFNAYNITTIEVFVLSTVAIATVRANENDKIITQIKRIDKTSTDLSRFEDYNSLSRYIVSNAPDYEYINKEVEKIQNEKINSKYVDVSGYVVGTTFFCMFFGGNFIDAIASGIIGFLIYLMNTYLRQDTSNKVIYTLFASIVSGSVAYFFVKIGLGQNIDKIIIGDIMLFIPGLVILNAVKDMFYGDIISGIFAFVESIIIAMAIVAGFAVPSFLFGGMI